LNSAGELLSKLSVPSRHPDVWDPGNNGWFFQPPKLFEINGKLGWPHLYSSTSDTTIHVLKYSTDEAADSTGIDLPAGQGIYVLWVDQNLNIVDHTLFSFSVPSLGDAGVSIHNIKLLNQDTLLIDGKI